MRFVFRLAPLVVLAAALLTTAQAQRNPLQDVPWRLDVPADRTLAPPAARQGAPAPAWTAKVDPALAALVAASPSARRAAAVASGPEPVALAQAGGETVVDVFVQSPDPRALRAVPGAELRTVAGDVAVLRVPLDAVLALAQRADVVFVEAARVRPALNDAARADTRVDAVQAGEGGLPRAFRGAGVFVGVLDSGLDVTHPAFKTADGRTRVDWLLEYREGEGNPERVWTRAEIDAGQVTQIDGNGGGGHGTHVTGTAAGSGTQHRGVAPDAEILFVKGVRPADGGGGFSDADVIDGVSRMMQRAAAQNKPVVVNLSLGGHFSPHDGTSLYERALSNLTGPGRIIVAAAGNSGGDFIHAGEAVQPNVLNETIWFPDGPEVAFATMWYDAGSQTQFGIGAYEITADNKLRWLGYAAQTTAGNRIEATFAPDGVPLGTVEIDARTVADPRNGDGNAVFAVTGGDGVDISETVWSVISKGPAAGRVDTWALRSEFLNRELGFPDQNEIPGDHAMTVGTPSTALGVLAVGAHVTASRWTNVDGNTYSRNPEVEVGTRALFSSRGPTRDGRTSPDVMAPGEFIASAMSSDLDEGDGVQRSNVLPGGYSIQQGTSMASPHAAGIVALMLQADPSLTPDEARSILQATARSDGFTGAVPNNDFGSGKADALAAVVETLTRCGAPCAGNGGGGGGGGGGGSGSQFSEAEPNNAAAQAQALAGAFPMTIAGAAEAADQGALRVRVSLISEDDLEDLYRVTTTGAGLKLVLSGYTEDLDLYLVNEGLTTVLARSNSTGPTETIDLPNQAAGTYYVGVSFYDAGGQTGASPYALRIESANPVAEETEPAGGLVLHPVAPNPVRGRAAVEFELAEPADVRVEVYDMLGRRVAVLAEGPHRAGPQAVSLDASALGAGTYAVRLAAGGEVRTARLVVVR